jgi:RND superfamily putative drug exporter
MIGLGVGIDYSLFVMNRYKQDLDAGTEPKEAALEAAKSAGRAVFFAALTVIIGLLGLFVMGIGFFNGLAIAAAVTVVMMMIGATVLLPAVLSLLGKRAFALRMPWARKPKPYDPDNRLFAKYALWLETHFKWFGAVALVVLIAIASPVASLRLGFSDDSGKAATNPARVAYDLVSEGFGAGLNGPFIVAIETKTAGDQMAVAELANVVSQDAGVAAAIPFPMDPVSTYGAMSVIPDSSPQDEATTDLLNRLRDEVIPSVTNNGKLDAYVGGTQAITSDFTKVLVDALPLFLTVVIGLGFVTLIFLFRSILVPLTGALTSLLSLSAAMGVTVAVFQWGWFADLVGLQATGPIQPFLPIMVFAILFGLSMDYQVFLVSAMQEKWNETGDNEQAVRRGMGISGRVVAIAASIMFSVFAAFILGNDPTIKLFGIALSTAVLFDAFIVRLIIVPSLMFTFDKANWWLPNFLKKLLPNVSAH